MADADEGRDNERDKAEVYLENLTDCICEITSSLADKGDEALNLRDKGSVLINHIQVAKSELGITDIRSLGPSDGSSLLLDVIKDFYSRVSDFDNSHGNFNRGFLKIYKKNEEKLLSSLESNWNVNLSKDNRGYIFAKSTPKKTGKQKLHCEVETCKKPYTNATSLQRHLKSAHSIVKIVPKPRVTCRLCCTSILEDQICKHLRDKHKKSKPEGSEFRGFESWDTGRTWAVCWRKDGEADPKSLQIDSKNDDIKQTISDAKKKDEVVNDEAGEPSKVKAIKEVGEPSKLRSDSSVNDEFCDDNHYHVAVEHAKIDEDCDDEDYNYYNSNCHLLPVTEKPTNNNDEDFEMDDVFVGKDHEYNKFHDEIKKVDDDEDVDDPDEFTKNRINNKVARYKKRNNLPENDLCSLDGNKDFIEDFSRYVRKGAKSTNPNLSTLASMTGQLFRWKNSWLRYESEKDPSFRMSKLIIFHDRDQLIQLQNPTKWTETVAGADGKQNAIDRKQMFKAHHKLQEYLLEKLNEHEEGNELLDMVWKEKLMSKIKKIKEDVDRSGVWGLLNSQIETNKRKKDAAREVVNPGKSMKEANANQVYFNSETFRVRADRMEKIFRDAVDKEKSDAKKKIGVKNFNAYGNFARHILAFTDRTRRSTYDFKNKAYFNRKECWVPVGYSFEDLKDFTGLDIHTKPPDGRAADFHFIYLAGDEVIAKRQEASTVVVTKFAYSILYKYRQLKDIVHGQLDPEDPFFSNYFNASFSPMAKKKGSILEEYGEVTGLDFITQTAIRRTMEPRIQSDPILKPRSKTIAQHDVGVGQKYYDATAPAFRGVTMHLINEAEGTNKLVEEEEDVPDDVVAKRMRLDETDRAANVANARKFLQEDANKNVKRNKAGNKMSSEDRDFLQTVFSAGGDYEGIFNGFSKFPDAALFRKLFYRIIDTLEDDDPNKERLLEIEISAFRDVKKDVGEWNSTVEVNMKADLLIATKIRTSFASYEKTRGRFQKSFFSF